MLMFAGVALIHPVFWMISSYIDTGDPLYSFAWSSHWERDAMGRSDLPIGDRVRAVLVLVWFTVKGMTPLVAVPAALGAGLAVVHRSRQALWLLPCGGLFALLVIGCLRGAFVPRPFYTVTFGLLLIPYLAVILNRLGIEQLSATRFTLVAVACVASVLAVSVPDGLRTVPVVRWLGGMSPVPGFPGQDLAMRLIDQVKPQFLGPDDGFVSDFYGWQPSYYVALRTGLHPDRIFVAPGAPNEPLDLAALGSFLDRYPRGVLLLDQTRAFVAPWGSRAIGRRSRAVSCRSSR